MEGRDGKRQLANAGCVLRAARSNIQLMLCLVFRRLEAMRAALKKGAEIGENFSWLVYTWSYELKIDCHHFVIFMCRHKGSYNAGDQGVERMES